MTGNLFCLEACVNSTAGLNKVLLLLERCKKDQTKKACAFECSLISSQKEVLGRETSVQFAMDLSRQKKDYGLTCH